MPIVAKQTCFALKGGTAINLFLRDLPRLSVDIDLTYLPIQSRADSLMAISESLKSIATEIERTFSALKVQRISSLSRQLIKLIISNGNCQVKIEPNCVIRGEVYPSEIRSLSAEVQKKFALELEAPVMSIADIYGGKICAALDRQHPRDLFDILEMFESVGLTIEIRKAFIVYLASHDRPISEILMPSYKDFSLIFENEFYGMAFRSVAYAELLGAREQLVKVIAKDLTSEEREFLLSIKRGEPEWALLGVTGVESLPAIQWKLMNIRKMPKQKHVESIDRLKRVLEI